MTVGGLDGSAQGDGSTRGPRHVGPEPARQLSRRAVIGGLAASGLTAGVIGSLLAACSDGSDPSESEPDPSAASEAEEAIIRVGRRYRADHPEEDDREVLRERLGVAAEAAGSALVLSSLDAQVAEDYGAGRTVWLDGWVLSVTEGRAAALVSLA